MMGDEVYQIFKSNCVKEDELTAIKEKLKALLVTKRSEYTEICAFRRAKKHCDETGMVEVEKACVRDDNLDLAKVLSLALGFERSANQLRGLR